MWHRFFYIADIIEIRNCKADMIPSVITGLTEFNTDPSSCISIHPITPKVAKKMITTITPKSMLRRKYVMFVTAFVTTFKAE